MVKKLSVPDRWEASEKLADGGVDKYYSTLVTSGVCWAERLSVLLTKVVLGGVCLDGVEEFMLTNAWVELYWFQGCWFCPPQHLNSLPVVIHKKDLV